MSEKKHIYFVPGLAASAEIFEFIKLPSDEFETHVINWLVPESMSETLDHYAMRMSKFVEFPNAVLVGVSFGGVMVQEMKKYVHPSKVIIISSVKNKHEMPKIMHFARKISAYKILPTSVISNIEKYEKYFFGHKIKNRIQIYKKYLSMRDDMYLPWAIRSIVNWDREISDPEIIHIHGTNDFVFPAKNVKDFIKIDHGTHIMILIKSKRVTALLHTLLSQ